MSFKDGDFLEIEYSVWSASDSSLISTTDEKKAEQAGIHSDKAYYGPMLVVLGSNSIIKGLDRELRNMALNETKKFTFKPDDAFGDRDEELVRVMPLSEFRRREIEPYPGMQVNLDEMTAIVKSVNSGRVTVDANNPYAGRELVYEARIVRNLTVDTEKITALGRTYGIKPTSVSISNKALSVSFGDDVKKTADYFIARTNLVASAFTYLKDVEKVLVQDEYVKPAEAKEKK